MGKIVPRRFQAPSPKAGAIRGWRRKTTRSPGLIVTPFAACTSETAAPKIRDRPACRAFSNYRLEWPRESSVGAAAIGEAFSPADLAHETLSREQSRRPGSGEAAKNRADLAAQVRPVRRSAGRSGQLRISGERRGFIETQPMAVVLMRARVLRHKAIMAQPRQAWR